MEKGNDKMVLKLLIDKKSNKVLFGEARKHVVDFIFSILALPLGAATKLLIKEGMVGSIGELYHSLSNLNEAYILSRENVSSLLNPTVSTLTNSGPSFHLPLTAAKTKTLYLCSKSDSMHKPIRSPFIHTFGSCNSYNRTLDNSGSICRQYVSEFSQTNCPNCGTGMNTEARIASSKSSDIVQMEGGNTGEGCVKGVVTYSVIDDLSVVPMSPISTITVLNKFQIKKLSYLEEQTVTLGFDELRYILFLNLLSVFRILISATWDLN